MHLVVGSRELIDPTDIEANEAEFVMVKSDFGILLSSPEQHRNKTLEKLIFGLQVVISDAFPTSQLHCHRPYRPHVFLPSGI